MNTPQFPMSFSDRIEAISPGFKERMKQKFRQQEITAATIALNMHENICEMLHGDLAENWTAEEFENFERLPAVHFNRTYLQSVH